LFAFWKGEIQSAEDIPKGRRTKRESSFLDAVRDQDFSELLTLWSLSTGDFETGQPTQMLNGVGNVITTAKSFERWGIPLDQNSLSAGQAKETVYETFKLELGKIRVILRPVIEDDQLIYFVRVGKPLKQEQAMLWRLRRWILWLVPVTLVLSSLLGWFLALRALSPVKEMTRKAALISMRKLDERLELPKANDEISKLAETFNKMLNRIEISVKGLRRFSAAAAHELRTPLTAMKGELELALHKPRDREAYKEIVEIQLETVNDMIHTVEQLLAVARSGADVALNLKAVDVQELIKEAIDKVKTIAAKKNIAFDYKQVAAVSVNGDATLLRIVFQNLLENAVKHSPDGSSINVTSEQKKGILELKVQDQGKGIAPDELPKLFDH